MQAQESPQPTQLTMSEAWKIYREYDLLSTPDLFSLLYPGAKDVSINDMLSFIFIGLYMNHFEQFIEFINGMKKHGNKS